VLDSLPSLKVTVVDDDAEDREALVEELLDNGCVPKTIEGRYASDINRMIEDIVDHGSDLVICDHKLQPKQMATFSGAELVAELVERRLPSILLTMYRSPARVEILKLRHQIPVVVGRDEFDHGELLGYLKTCRQEFEGEPIASRKAHRVIIRVEDIRRIGGDDFVCDVVVPSWRPGHAVTVPKECFSPDVWASIEAGDRYLGYVNIDADDEDDLYLKSISERS